MLKLSEDEVNKNRYMDFTYLNVSSIFFILNKAIVTGGHFVDCPVLPAALKP